MFNIDYKVSPTPRFFRGWLETLLRDLNLNLSFLAVVFCVGLSALGGCVCSVSGSAGVGVVLAQFPVRAGHD